MRDKHPSSLSLGLNTISGHFLCCSGGWWTRGPHLWNALIFNEKEVIQSECHTHTFDTIVSSPAAEVLPPVGAHAFMHAEMRAPPMRRAHLKWQKCHSRCAVAFFPPHTLDTHTRAEIPWPVVKDSSFRWEELALKGEEGLLLRCHVERGASVGPSKARGRKVRLTHTHTNTHTHTHCQMGPKHKHVSQTQMGHTQKGAAQINAYRHKSHTVQGTNTRRARTAAGLSTKHLETL